MKIFALFLVLALVHQSHQDVVRSVDAKIIEKDTSDTPLNKAAKQCGGAGKLVNQHNQLCKDSTEEVCKTSSNGDITVETNFEPSKDIEKLGWRLSGKFEDGDFIVNHDEEIPNSAVKKDKLAHIHATISSGVGFKGKLTLKYEIYDMADKVVDVCIQVNFEFV